MMATQTTDDYYVLVSYSYHTRMYIEYFDVNSHQPQQLVDGKFVRSHATYYYWPASPAKL